MSGGPRGAWRAPSARPEQGPLPEGGAETYVYRFLLVRDGQPEGKGFLLARWELEPREYARLGGRACVEREVDNQRRAWARLARSTGEQGSVIVVKMRGYRRALWPAGAPGEVG